MNMDVDESPSGWAPFCRACLVTSNLKSVLSDEDLRIKFKEITSIEINEEDILIALLCKDCIDVMNLAHQFRTQCLCIHEQMKTQLLKINNDVSLGNTNEEANNIILKKRNSLSNEITNHNDTEEDEFYVLVVNDDENPAINRDSISNNETEYEFEDDKSNKCLLGNQVKIENDTDVEETNADVNESKNNDVNVGINNSEFMKLEYNFLNNSTNPSNNDNVNVIQLYKDSSINSKIVKLETSVVNNEASTEDNVTYTQEEIVVSNGEDAYEIINCDISELNLEHIDQRAIWQRDDGSFLCECGEVYTDLSEFEKHIATHNNQTCHICHKNIESKEVLKCHLKVHEHDLLRCSYCLKSIKRSLLSAHINANHVQVKPTCNICNKTFSTEHNRKRHLAMHFDGKIHECDICHVQFSQKKTLDNHQMIHKNLKYLNCNTCLTVYPPEEAHLHETCCTSIFENNVTKTTSCNKCETTFDNLQSLQNHLDLFHPQQSSWLCPACGLIFPNKKALCGHICSNRNKPKNSKRFICGECGKGCPSQAMLTMHERVHTNERPFKCNKCILAFKTKTHLTTHQLTHTQEKKFSCSICPKAFSLRGNLVVHIRTHTGERPYGCNICKQAFIDSKYLKKHKMRRHAAEEALW